MKTSTVWSFRLIAPIALALALAACPKSSEPATSTTSQTGDTGTGGTASVGDAGTTADTGLMPGRGEPCGAQDVCAEGLQCITYYGIAGPRGPEFKSCETPCAGGAKCPTGTTCTTIADGPGQVCR